MNKLEVTLKRIQKADSIHLTNFDYKGCKLKMLSLELHESLKEGSKVTLATKATHISIAKEFIEKVSCANQFLVKVEAVKKGELISVVKLDFHGSIMESVLSTKALEKANIQKDDEVVMLIKSSDISILEIIDA